MAAPKGGLLAILGASGEAKAEPDAELSAAGDLISAMKRGDRAGVKAAFQDMYDACSMGGGEDSEEEEDAEEE